MTRKYSNDELCTRSYVTEFEAKDDERGVVYGHPIVFNQDTVIHDWAGDFIERISPHALDNADLKDVRFFVNHDTNAVTLARSKNGNGTMSFDIREDGMHIRAELDIDNNPRAAEVHSAIKRGDMDGMSFMFRVRGEEWLNLESDCPIRNITDISIVHEVSVVNFPAYQGTSISARSMEETSYSPLAEARAKRSEETENSVLEMERLKNSNYMRFMRR